MAINVELHLDHLQISEDTKNWIIVNAFVDIMFLFDIILIFSTTYSEKNST